MSVIHKILLAECSDPSAVVCFVVVLRCPTDLLVQESRDTLADFGGDITVEADGDSFLLLFKGAVGLNPEPVLLELNRFLDLQPLVELVETKYMNDGLGTTQRHSFSFAQDGTPDKTTIILSPSHAFGSGEHPSTGLAIEFMEELAPLAGKVLDIGCGTGVLAFVAARLGAEQVRGVDIDQEGIRGADVNATLNQLEHKVEFSTQPVAEVTGGFPLILANLTCSVLRYLLADLSKLASLPATLIVSGLQGRQGGEAQEFLREFGWQVTGRKSMGKWRALLARKR